MLILNDFIIFTTINTEGINPLESVNYMSKPVLVEISAHHVHVTKEALATLFGEDATLGVRKMLSQPGQFASDKKVKVIGPKGSFNASILGPERSANQVEVSLTDARSLGVDAPIRESGDIAGSAPITLEGPCGTVELKEGCIVAKRHVHLDPASAEEYGVKNGDVVSVKIESPLGRSLTFSDVVIRVSKKFAPAMHVDTDEGNAAGIKGTVFGAIIK